MDASRFLATMGGQPEEGRMSFKLLAIDLGKQSFHVHGMIPMGWLSRARSAEPSWRRWSIVSTRR